MSEFDDDDWGDFDAFGDDPSNDNVKQNPPTTVNDHETSTVDDADDDDDDNDDEWGDFDTQFTNYTVTKPNTNAIHTNAVPQSANNDTETTSKISLQHQNIDTVDNHQNNGSKVDVEQHTPTRDIKNSILSKPTEPINDDIAQISREEVDGDDNNDDDDDDDNNDDDDDNNDDDDDDWGFEDHGNDAEMDKKKHDGMDKKLETIDNELIEVQDEALNTTTESALPQSMDEQSHIEIADIKHHLESISSKPTLQDQNEENQVEIEKEKYNAMDISNAIDEEESKEVDDDDVAMDMNEENIIVESMEAAVQETSDKDINDKMEQNHVEREMETVRDVNNENGEPEEEPSHYVIETVIQNQVLNEKVELHGKEREQEHEQQHRLQETGDTADDMDNEEKEEQDIKELNGNEDMVNITDNDELNVDEDQLKELKQETIENVSDEQELWTQHEVNHDVENVENHETTEADTVTSVVTQNAIDDEDDTNETDSTEPHTINENDIHNVIQMDVQTNEIPSQNTELDEGISNDEIDIHNDLHSSTESVDKEANRNSESISPKSVENNEKDMETNENEVIPDQDTNEINTHDDDTKEHHTIEQSIINNDNDDKDNTDKLSTNNEDEIHNQDNENNIEQPQYVLTTHDQSEEDQKNDNIDSPILNHDDDGEPEATEITKDNVMEDTDKTANNEDDNDVEIANDNMQHNTLTEGMKQHHLRINENEKNEKKHDIDELEANPIDNESMDAQDEADHDNDKDQHDETDMKPEDTNVASVEAQDEAIRNDEPVGDWSGVDDKEATEITKDNVMEHADKTTKNEEEIHDQDNENNVENNSMKHHHLSIDQNEQNEQDKGPQVDEINTDANDIDNESMDAQDEAVHNMPNPTSNNDDDWGFDDDDNDKDQHDETDMKPEDTNVASVEAQDEAIRTDEPVGGLSDVDDKEATEITKDNVMEHTDKTTSNDDEIHDQDNENNVENNSMKHHHLSIDESEKNEKKHDIDEQDKGPQVDEINTDGNDIDNELMDANMPNPTSNDDDADDDDWGFDDDDNDKDQHDEIDMKSEDTNVAFVEAQDEAIRNDERDVDDKEATEITKDNVMEDTDKTTKNEDEIHDQDNENNTLTEGMKHHHQNEHNEQDKGPHVDEINTDANDINNDEAVHNMANPTSNDDDDDWGFDDHDNDKDQHNEIDMKPEDTNVALVEAQDEAMRNDERDVDDKQDINDIEYSKTNHESQDERENTANAELPVEDEDDDDDLTLSTIESPQTISASKSEQTDVHDKDSDLDLTLDDNNDEEEVIYMSDQEEEPNKYDDLPKHILKDNDTKPQKTTTNDANIDDNDFGDDDWGDFGDNDTKQKVIETQETPTNAQDNDITEEPVKDGADDWDDDDWGDFDDTKEKDDAEPTQKDTNDTQKDDAEPTQKDDAESTQKDDAEPTKEKDDAEPTQKDDDDWGDDTWGDDEAFDAAPPPPDVHQETPDKEQTPQPTETETEKAEIKIEEKHNDDIAVVDTSVLNKILSVNEDPNVQFNALCKMLYTFGGVCATIQEKYLSDDKEYSYYAGTEDESKDNVKNALPELAMPLSIKPSDIDDFVWDKSIIESKLYEAIKLPKPKPRRKDDEKGKEQIKRPKKDRAKERRNSSKIDNVKDNGSVPNTPLVEEKDNAHADVFAMFGDVFKNGTNPGKRSKNVEDVLKDMPKVEENTVQNVTTTEPKKDLLAELFDGLNSTNNISHTNGEIDEKHKEKMRAAAAREIKKIISSIPDLSFLKNIKVT